MNNNETLKAVKSPHIKDSLTQKHLTEILRCTDDVLYFMSNFMKVQHPVKGAIKFNPYDFQIRLINAFTQHKKSIIMFGRQLRKDNLCFRISFMASYV